MNEEFEIEFSKLISVRNWYDGTSINRSQANELKRRFNKKELSEGRILEVLKECGYNIKLEKHVI